MTPWIGVDLDGTLAKYDGWRGEEHIGDPIPLMVDRVKTGLAAGLDFRIFTARAYRPSLTAIEAWCLKHLGRILPITNEKDFGMIELWDDRAIQVVINTGVRVDGKP